MKKKQKKLEEKSKLDSSLRENNLTVKKDYTVSIAVPGNILDNAQSPELKTYLAGQVSTKHILTFHYFRKCMQKEILKFLACQINQYKNIFVLCFWILRCFGF